MATPDYFPLRGYSEKVPYLGIRVESGYLGTEPKGRASRTSEEHRVCLLDQVVISKWSVLEARIFLTDWAGGSGVMLPLLKV